MKKQELIHIHGLLAEVAGYCREDGIDIETESYDALGTRPTSIQQSKTAHKEAVFALGTAITGELEVSVEPVPANAD